MCVATKDRAVVPKIAREGNVKKRFLTGEQQDAHEFMRYLLATIEEETEGFLKQLKSRQTRHIVQCLFSPEYTPLPRLYFSKTDLVTAARHDAKSGLKSLGESNDRAAQQSYHKLKTSLGWTTNPFCGVLESVLECAFCGYKSLTRQHFMDLSLAPPTRPRAREEKITDLERALWSYVREEKIRDLNCVGCVQRGMPVRPHSRIRRQWPITKRLAISRLPKLLCLHWQRLQVSRLSSYLQKNTERFTFPLELNMYPFSSFNIGEFKPPEVYEDDEDDESQSEDEHGTNTNSNTHVRVRSKFPLLDLIPDFRASALENSMFALPSTQPAQSVAEEEELKTEELVRKRDLIATKLAPTEQDKHEAKHVNYRLVAVIAHTGGAFGGHYTIFRKLLDNVPVFNYDQLIDDWHAAYHATTDTAHHHSNTHGSSHHARHVPSQWVYISDDSYRYVSESTVLQSEAYMLFYERE